MNPLTTLFSASPILTTSLVLVASNVFMALAWYAQLNNLNDKPWWIAALISYGIALFETKCFELEFLS